MEQDFSRGLEPTADHLEFAVGLADSDDDQGGAGCTTALAPRTVQQQQRERQDAELKKQVARVFGEVKGARAEMIKLQGLLRKTQRDFNKQFEAVRFMLTNYASRQQAQAGAASVVATGTASAGGGGGGGRTGGSKDAGSGAVLQWNEPMKPIGYLRSCFVRKNGTPRQGGLAQSARAKLTLTCFDTPAPSLDSLQDFSHVWVLFIFHQNGKATAKPKVAPPRLGGDHRVGACVQPPPTS